MKIYNFLAGYNGELERNRVGMIEKLGIN